MIFHEKKYSQNSACLLKKIICLIFNKLTDLLIWATNLEARAPQLKCLGDQRALSFRPGHPSLNAWEPEGLPYIFNRAQPCSPVVIGSMIHYMLLLNVEVHFLRTLLKGMQILVNYPILLTYMVVILM